MKFTYLKPKIFTYQGDVYAISDLNGAYVDIIDELTEQFIKYHGGNVCGWDELFEVANVFAEKFASKYA
jgi:hypothetical protein